jgi:transposase
VGYDAGKKIKGRKRHAVVDTLGLMLGVGILPANIQDRDGCLPVLKEVRRLFPFLQRIVADGGYQGANTAAAVRQAAGASLEMPPRASSPFPSAGSSSAPSAGSTAAGAWPETSSTAPAATSPSSRSP